MDRAEEGVRGSLAYANSFRVTAAQGWGRGVWAVPGGREPGQERWPGGQGADL